MISFIPLFGVAYICFILASLFGVTGYMFESFPFGWELPSGKNHTPTNSYIIVAIGVVLLFVELLKATKTSSLAVYDHVLSTLVFVAYLVTYLMAPWAGNSVFFIFMLFSLLDVIAGFSITIKGARRDLGFGNN